MSWLALNLRRALGRAKATASRPARRFKGIEQPSSARLSLWETRHEDPDFHRPARSTSAPSSGSRPWMASTSSWSPATPARVCSRHSDTCAGSCRMTIPIAMVMGNHEYYRRFVPERAGAGQRAGAVIQHRCWLRMIALFVNRLGRVCDCRPSLWTDYATLAPAMLLRQCVPSSWHERSQVDRLAEKSRGNASGRKRRCCCIFGRRRS